MSRLAIIRNYDGLCHICGSNVTKQGSFIAEEVYITDLERVVYTVTPANCPHCNYHHHYLRVWRDMDVTEELTTLDKSRKHENR